MSETAYPVRVDSALDPAPSRWLWLVKWLLLLPHAVVLALLWCAAAVVWVVSLVAVLATGRMPDALFDLQLGVLRWTWRVWHYGYGALGTDRYPPFTLAEVPDHPAHLTVERPVRVSRGLALVRWLLALPHYLVLGVFLGGGGWLVWQTGEDSPAWGAGGLVGLLVLVAGVVVLFTGRYPAPVYDFVLGMDRWALRVAAYLLFLTDRYPPFRLDTGGVDPGSVPVPPSPVGPVPPAAGARSASAGGWTGGRVAAVVVGSLLLLSATAPLVAGGSLAWADRTQREDGWLTSGDAAVATDGYAVVSPEVELQVEDTPVVVERLLGDTRLTAMPGSDDELFLGLARAEDVDAYLGGVARQVDSWPAEDPAGAGWVRTGPGIDRWYTDAGSVELAGTRPATPPGEQDIWVTSTSGAGPLTLTWTPQPGNWSAVLMRSDGGAGVDAEVSVGATAPGLGWIAAGLLVLGLVLLAVGGLLVGLAVRGASSTPGRAGPPPGGGGAPPPPPRSRPVEAPPVPAGGR